MPLHPAFHNPSLLTSLTHFCSSTSADKVFDGKRSQQLNCMQKTRTHRQQKNPWYKQEKNKYKCTEKKTNKNTDIQRKHQQKTHAHEETQTFLAPIRGYWHCHYWHLTGSSQKFGARAKCLFCLESHVWFIFVYSNLHDMTNSVTEISQTWSAAVGVVVNTPHDSMKEYIQVWENCCTCYLLTQHWVDLRL